MTTRTPQDYAIEHAEHLAQAAERLIEATNLHAALLLRIAESDDVSDDDEFDARASVDEASSSVRSGIYEFRKRRDRAALATESQGEPFVRYCPGCGSVGIVEAKYRDCCPDGSEARVIPKALADKCHDTFKLAIQSALTQPQEAAPTSELEETFKGCAVSWAVDRWIDEVKHRPMVNIHRRSLDGAWRQVISHFGGDPDQLIGPDHHTLRAAITTKELEAMNGKATLAAPSQDAAKWRSQHDADSKELRRLCEARDDYRKERDLLKVEVAGLQSSVGHLSRLVDELRPNAERYQLIRRGQHWSVIDGGGNELRAEALDAAADLVIGRTQEGK